MAQIYISVGSNTEREHYIRAAVAELTQALGVLQLSAVYESEAVGFKGAAFYNMVIGATTDLNAADCVRLFKTIEDRHGRDRQSARFSGRTLDLDLLTYDQLICTTPIELPRAEILQNAFVLWPLAEIAAEQTHPVVGQTYQQLWQSYDKEQRIWTVPFTF